MILYDIYFMFPGVRCFYPFCGYYPFWLGQLATTCKPGRLLTDLHRPDSSAFSLGWFWGKPIEDQWKTEPNGYHSFPIEMCIAPQGCRGAGIPMWFIATKMVGYEPNNVGYLSHQSL